MSVVGRRVVLRSMTVVAVETSVKLLVGLVKNGVAPFMFTERLPTLLVPVGPLITAFCVLSSRWPPWGC